VGPRALRPVETELKVGREAQQSGMDGQDIGALIDNSGMDSTNNQQISCVNGIYSTPPGSEFQRRHIVRPGLTGLAQIYAPRDATRRQKLKYDLLYVRSRSFWLDLKLIALSFWITFRGKWESKGKKT